MNRFLIGCFIIFFSSCEVIKIKELKRTQNVDNFIIYASVELEGESLKKTKFKTKINILKDSIVVLVYHPNLGLELGRVSVKEDVIDINQKFKKESESMAFSEIDPAFHLKTLQQSIIQLKHKRDTVSYKNKYIGLDCTNYVELDNFFVPEKIIYWDNRGPHNNLVKKTITLEYKSLKYINSNEIKD